MTQTTMRVGDKPDELSGRRRAVDPLTLVAAGVLLGHAPLAALHLRSLWQKEQYQYFPFVIAAILWLLVSRWREAPPSPADSRWRTLPWLILAAASFLLVGAILTVSGWLAFVSLNVSLAAIFIWIRGRREVPYLGGIWCLLWLMVPLPLNVDDRVVGRLQRLSSQLSSAILDMSGIRHLMSGNVLTLPSRELFVDEACSGIISVMSIAACSMIYAVWLNRTFFHLILLTLLGVFWAVVMNVVRIYVIAVADYAWQTDLTAGTPHEILSLAVFLVTFLALISTDQLLLGLLAPIGLSKIGEQRFGRRLISAWNRWLASGQREVPAEFDSELAQPAPARSPLLNLRSASIVGAAFLALGVVQLVWWPSPNTAEASRAIAQALALEEEALPRRIGPWQREGFEAVERDAYSDFGRYSRSYTFRHANRPEVTANVSLDFPYLGGWHDLCMCYRGGGWATEERNIVSDEWPYVDADLDRADGRARVLFAGFDINGAVAEPPSDAVLFRPWFRLRRRLLHEVAPQLFQVQVFATGGSVEDQTIERDLKQLLVASRERLREQVATGREHAPATNSNRIDK